MRFFDSFKIAMHNLWQNKSRTVLTIIIVLVVSALIMAMCLLGTNFISNNERMLKHNLDKTGTYYSLYGKQSHTTYTQPKLDEAMIAIRAARKYPDGVDYSGLIMQYGGSRDTAGLIVSAGMPGVLTVNDPTNLGYFDFSYPMPIRMCGDIVEGRTWNAADNEKNGIWLSTDAMKTASQAGTDLSVGDKIPVTFTAEKVTQTEYGDRSVVVDTYTADYELTGVFKAVETEHYRQLPPDYIVSVFPIAEEFAHVPLEIGELRIGFARQPGDYNYRDAENSMKALVKEVNGQLEHSVDYEGKKIERFSNDFLEQSVMIRIMSLLIMGILVVLAFLILLLSIGSVANTIIISVDKNRKFIGLMKAMGLKNKGVKQIVYKEAVVTIFIGVLLATCLILAMSGVMGKLIATVLGSMYGSEFTMTFVVSPYVPIVTAFAFFGMAILFSKGSLNRMGKADVITIISEVA